MAIAPVLKTGARKGLGVRIPRAPSKNGPDCSGPFLFTSTRRSTLRHAHEQLLVFTVAFRCERRVRNEPERRRVHAIPLTGRPRTIVEHVAEMRVRVG